MTTDWEGFEKGEARKELLITVAGTGALLLTALLAPPVGAMIGKFFQAYRRAEERNRSHRYRARIKQLVKELADRRLVEVTQQPDGLYIQITEEGQRRVRRFELESLTIPTPMHWDGRWRTIGFDIPERYKTARDALRQLLKRLEFFPLQKSVWIYPYPCRDEIEIIRYAYGLSSELWFAEADTVDREPELLEHFGLLGEARRLLKIAPRRKR